MVADFNSLAGYITYKCSLPGIITMIVNFYRKITDKTEDVFTSSILYSKSTLCTDLYFENHLQSLLLKFVMKHQSWAKINGKYKDGEDPDFFKFVFTDFIFSIKLIN